MSKSSSCWRQFSVLLLTLIYSVFLHRSVGLLWLPYRWKNILVLKFCRSVFIAAFYWFQKAPTIMFYLHLWRAPCFAKPSDFVIQLGSVHLENTICHVLQNNRSSYIVYWLDWPTAKNICISHATAWLLYQTLAIM